MSDIKVLHLVFKQKHNHFVKVMFGVSLLGRHAFQNELIKILKGLSSDTPIVSVHETVDDDGTATDLTITVQGPIACISQLQLAALHPYCEWIK
jgi:hypothetical protein